MSEKGKAERDKSINRHRTLIEIDEVVIIGEQGSGIIKADDLARKLDIIYYEVVTRINLVTQRIIL